MLRKVLFTNGMSNDAMIILTDAPKQDIERWCIKYNIDIEEQNNFELFDSLMTQYYVKILHDSEIDMHENIEAIGYDESYDLNDYEI